ncbi:MAG: hypothetical protein ACRDJW_18570 [Thermomicrobiales bacterium]
MAIEHPSRVHPARSGGVEPAPYDETSVVWVFLWTLFVFKIATVGAIVWVSRGTDAWALLTATTWPFLVIPAAAVAGPAVFYFRLRRVRRRREQLRRAEWMLDG